MKYRYIIYVVISVFITILLANNHLLFQKDISKSLPKISDKEKNLSIKRDVDKTTDLIDTSTQEKLEIRRKLTWTPRTLSGIPYQFGSGNPQEVDKSVEELRKIYIDCVKSDNSSCRNHIPYYEQLVDTYDEEMNPIHTGNIARITPEIEYVLYQFLSHPILYQSTEACGVYFWNYQQTYDQYGSSVTDIYMASEEYGPPKWWDPYDIDINDYIRINPYTGRKDINLNLIITLNTQIQTPSEKEGGKYHTNTALVQCLQEHNLLIPLQNHVQTQFETLRKMWYEN
jgi:hypothetical protein